jgi:hypothetical protein
MSTMYVRFRVNGWGTVVATNRTHLINEPSALTVNVMFSRKFDRTRSHCTGSRQVRSVNHSHSLLKGQVEGGRCTYRSDSRHNRLCILALWQGTYPVEFSTLCCRLFSHNIEGVSLSMALQSPGNHTTE